MRVDSMRPRARRRALPRERLVLRWTDARGIPTTPTSRLHSPAPCVAVATDSRMRLDSPSTVRLLVMPCLT
jgi:hypothetical protein